MKKLAATILSKFAELGVRVPPNSRLAVQANAYLDPKEELPEIIQPSHPIFATAVEGQRDLRQVAFILDQLWSVVPHDDLRKRLQQIIGDPVLPQDSSVKSFGRDVQCELLVAAICSRAKLDPVLNESPDVRIIIDGQTFGVAVKRIKSENRFEEQFTKHFRKAVQQISASRLPGIIVIDINRSLNPGNIPVGQQITVVSFDHMFGADLRQLVKSLRDDMLRRTKGTLVRGIIFLDHHVRNDKQQGWGLELGAIGTDLCPYNQHRRREFENFEARFSKAIINPGD